MQSLDNTLTQRLGGRLRAARTALGLSLSELSKRTGGALRKARISNAEPCIWRMSLASALTLASPDGTMSVGHLLASTGLTPSS